MSVVAVVALAVGATVDVVDGAVGWDDGLCVGVFDGASVSSYVSFSYLNKNQINTMCLRKDKA